MNWVTYFWTIPRLARYSSPMISLTILFWLILYLRALGARYLQSIGSKVNLGP